MRILVTGGGTGGHINPAIAIAQYFKANDKDAKILYAGTPNGMEARLVKQAGFEFVPIEVKGFYRSFTPKDVMHNFSAVATVLRSKSKANTILDDFKPDIVIGTGGYVCGPIVLAATKRGIKTAIHEQNAFPGVTNRLLAKKVDMVFLAVEEARKHLDSNICYQVVGNPVRESVIYKSKAEAKKELGLDDRMCILSFGGSLGADTLNKIAADIIEWHYQKGIVNHIHGYGRLGKEKFPALLKERQVDLSLNDRVQVLEFIDNMDTCMAAADLVICRAGAITISEIEATGKPAILVPSPNVTANHQYHNAMVLKGKNGAVLLEEKDYTKQTIVKIVNELYNEPTTLEELSKNASKLAILDTTKRIYDTMVGLLK